MILSGFFFLELISDIINFPFNFVFLKVGRVELGHQLKVMAGTLVASPLKGFPFLFIVKVLFMHLLVMYALKLSF